MCWSASSPKDTLCTGSMDAGKTHGAPFGGKLTPAAWSAPPWVLQESGYALKGNKALVLFREMDVEIPGLQGDLEYIPFDPRNPTLALQRASEMINGLIAKAGGNRVEPKLRPKWKTSGRTSQLCGAPSSHGTGNSPSGSTLRASNGYGHKNLTRRSSGNAFIREGCSWRVGPMRWRDCE